mmetsp:Transcript_14088/g.21063  ORF Transcript_14088/g.21063 Transcript_14088/m.21063 type:complete len:1076 (-) Transcript_14088:337-3564(-)
MDVDDAVPDHCIVCYSLICPGRSVLFHCECNVAFCQECAFKQITVQHYTYLRGLMCPCCREPSYNLSGVEECQISERKLIGSATKFFSKQKHTKGEQTLRQLLKRAILAGHKCSITLKDLEPSPEESINLGPQCETSTVRLELARVEKRRLNKLNGIDGDELPLGPLEHISIARNIFLEQAIALQAKLRQLNSFCRCFSAQEAMEHCSGSMNHINDSNTCEEEATGPISESNAQILPKELPMISDDSIAGDVCTKEPKQLCVCGDEEFGFYVQCMIGTGGCNGWVHPECVPSLQGMSKETLAELQDFKCPLCEYQIQLRQQIIPGSRVVVVSGKFEGKTATVLSTNSNMMMKLQFDEGLARTANVHIKNIEATTEGINCTVRDNAMEETSTTVQESVMENTSSATQENATAGTIDKVIENVAEDTNSVTQGNATEGTNCALQENVMESTVNSVQDNTTASTNSIVHDDATIGTICTARENMMESTNNAIQGNTTAFTNSIVQDDATEDTNCSVQENMMEGTSRTAQESVTESTNNTPGLSSVSDGIAEVQALSPHVASSINDIPPAVVSNSVKDQQQAVIVVNSCDDNAYSNDSGNYSRDKFSISLDTSCTTATSVNLVPSKEPLKLCICDGSGTGGYVECRQEHSCAGSRFYHLTCVGLPCDRNISGKRPQFLCSVCSLQASENIDTERSKSLESTSYPIESARTSKTAGGTLLSRLHPGKPKRSKKARRRADASSSTDAIRQSSISHYPAVRGMFSWPSTEHMGMYSFAGVMSQGECSSYSMHYQAPQGVLQHPIQYPQKSSPHGDYTDHMNMTSDNISWNDTSPILHTSASNSYMGSHSSLPHVQATVGQHLRPQIPQTGVLYPSVSLARNTSLLSEKPSQTNMKTNTVGQDDPSRVMPAGLSLFTSSPCVAVPTVSTCQSESDILLQREVSRSYSASLAESIDTNYNDTESRPTRKKRRRKSRSITSDKNTSNISVTNDSRPYHVAGSVYTTQDTHMYKTSYHSTERSHPLGIIDSVDPRRIAVSSGCDSRNCSLPRSGLPLSMSLPPCPRPPFTDFTLPKVAVDAAEANE